MADANYENVVLLLHADGVNGSKVVRDERGHALTCNGSAALSTTQSKFGGSSIAIATDTANKITAPASSDWAFGTGDFTVECWLYLTAYNAVGGRIMASGGGTVGFNSTTGIHWLFQSTSNGVIFSYWDGGTSSTGPSTTVALNTWTHIAVTRAGGTMRMFKDGTLSSTVTNSTGSPSTTPLLNIGCVPGEGAGSTQAFNGYLDEIRITKGLARYTATFTAPTAAFDHTTNSSIDPYFNNVVLQCHFDGADSVTVPYPDIKNSSITWQGGATLSTTQSKFGGSSAKFNGSNSYLTITANTNLNFGTGDFTIEGWIYPTGGGSSLINNQAGSNRLNLFATSSTSATLIVNNVNAITGITYTASTWQHVAIVRSGTTISVYVNGVSQGTPYNIGTTALDLSSSSNIGGYSGGHIFNGYIDEVRYTRGIARYTTTFTPPTAAFADATDDTTDGFYSKTSILQHMDDAVLSDVKGHAITLVGAAARSSVQSKFGGFSALFGGVSDGLTTPHQTDLDLATGGKDFTLEAWVYLPSGGGGAVISKDRNAGTTYPSYELYINKANQTVSFITGTGNLGTGGNSVATAAPYTVPLNTWTHVAAVRTGSTGKVYINGLLAASGAFSVTPSDGGQALAVGQVSLSNNGTYRFNGYIDDLRITKGVARYPTQFQLPTQAFYGILGFFDSLYLSQQYTITAPDKDSYFTNQQYSVTAPEKDSYFTNQQYSISAPVTDRLNVEQRYAVNAPIRDGLYTNQQYEIQQPARDSHYLNQQWGTNVVLITYVTLDSPVNVGSDLTGIKAVLTTLDSNLNVLSIGSFVFTLPITLISNLSVQTTISVRQIIGVLLNSILYAQPLLSARYTTKATLIETANTWVLNLETNATSQYDNFGFNSFATTPDGRQLACAEDGIYSINQSVNPTDVVPTLVQFPKTNFGTSAATNVHEVWLGVASHDKLVIKTITEQGTFYYTARTNTDTVDVTRVDLGKGVRSNYWDISLIGSTDLELETIEFFPISTSRRI